jgi:hypothetical protein
MRLSRFLNPPCCAVCGVLCAALVSPVPELSLAGSGPGRFRFLLKRQINAGGKSDRARDAWVRCVDKGSAGVLVIINRKEDWMDCFSSLCFVLGQSDKATR